MKHTKRILILLICITAIGALCATVFAQKHTEGVLSSDMLKVGETVKLTVSVSEVTASSMGVSVSCDDSLEIVEGKWLKSGLIVSYDSVKNKGVFTTGSTTDISGEVFEVTLRALRASETKATVSVSVIAKNGAATILEEIVSAEVSIKCMEHEFGEYMENGSVHSRRCVNCEYVESDGHKYSNGSLSNMCTVCENKVAYTGYVQEGSINGVNYARVIMVISENEIENADYEDFVMTVTVNGKQLVKKASELDSFDKVSAAGETYTSADDHRIFGVIIDLGSYKLESATVSIVAENSKNDVLYTGSFTSN